LKHLSTYGRRIKREKKSSGERKETGKLKSTQVNERLTEDGSTTYEENEKGVIDSEKYREGKERN